MTTWRKPSPSTLIYILIFCFPIFLDPVSSQTDTSNIALQNNALVSLPVNERDQDSTSGSSRKHPRRRPRDTPVEPRICNPLEVADLNGENYSCTCRPGYFIQNRFCVPPAILFTSNNTVYKLIQHPDSATTIRPCSASETDRKFCNAVQNSVLKPGKEPSKVRLQFDPYSLGYLLEDPETKCMSYHNLKDGNTTTLFCIPQEKRLHSSAMDFKVGTLFWMQTNNCGRSVGKCKDFRLYSRRISTGRSPPPFVPYGGFLSSLTIDPEHNTLFWVNKRTDATELIHTHYKNDEVSGEDGIISVEAHAILHAYNSHVLWIYPGDPYITYLDITNQTSEQTLKVDKPLQDFYILPAPQTINPCEEANCTHTCIPHHDLGLNLKYFCACPDGMILAPDNSCRPIQFLITRPPSSIGQTLYQTWKTSGSVQQTIAEFPVSTSAALNLIAFNFNTRTICRHDYASETTECVSGGKRFHVEEVDKGTSMLLLDDSGNEIFWNNGTPGCISLKSLSRDIRATFPCFETPGIHAEALDTRRKIFFWANKNQEICMKILYQKSSRPSKWKTETIIKSIALDIPSKYLYYTQMNTSTRQIYRLPYSSFTAGGQQPLEITPNHRLASTSIKYHENYIMFTQSASVSVMSLSNLKVISVLKSSTPPDTVNNLPAGATIIHIFGPSYQRNETRDPCETSSCSHFCFPSIAAPDIICGCSDGTQLGDDNATCSTGNLPTGWVIGITMLIFSVVAAVVIGITVVIMRRNRDAYLQRAKADFLKGDERRARMATNAADAALYLPLPVSYILQPSDVTVDYDTVLGEGQYGLVVKGKYKRNEVAIKTFKSLDLNIVVEFTKEIKIMAFIGDHPHVVHFHGTVVGRGFFYAVLELSTFGSLKDYLTETLRPPTAEYRDDRTLDMSVITKLVTWSEHIARGMEHLAHKRVIHGDLATRNVLLFPGYVAKVIDFGLARNYDPSYAGYQKRNLSPLPWKWMDYDALKFLKFSSASDVWAFGVTLWEIFTFGEMPFPQYNWDDEFTTALEQGLRLPKPKHAPDEIYNQIMMPCWELHRADRPTFTEIIRRLEDYSTLIQCTQVTERVVRFQNGRMERFDSDSSF